MRYLVFSSLVVTSALSGCSLYYESQAKDMVQRQMDAMVFVCLFYSSDAADE